MFGMVTVSNRKSDLHDILPANLCRMPEENATHKFKLPDGRIRTITISPLQSPIEEKIKSSPFVNKELIEDTSAFISNFIA